MVQDVVPLTNRAHHGAVRARERDSECTSTRMSLSPSAPKIINGEIDKECETFQPIHRHSLRMYLVLLERTPGIVGPLQTGKAPC